MNSKKADHHKPMKLPSMLQQILPTLAIVFLVTGLAVRFVSPFDRLLSLIWLFLAAVAVLILELPMFRHSEKAKWVIYLGYFLFFTGIVVQGLFFTLARPEPFTMQFQNNQWNVTHAGMMVPVGFKTRDVSSSGPLLIFGTALTFAPQFVLPFIVRAKNGGDRQPGHWFEIFRGLFTVVIGAASGFIVRDHRIYVFLFGWMLFFLAWTMHIFYHVHFHMVVMQDHKHKYNMVSEDEVQPLASAGSKIKDHY